MKKLFIFKNLAIILTLSVIFLNSLFQIYQNRTLIFLKIKYMFVEKRIAPVNPQILKNNKQTPPKNLENLKITNLNADVEGMWSAPVDWNVNTIHLLMMPDGKIMSYGTYGVKDKDNKDNININKEITLSDNLKIKRDDGDFQWQHHNVQAGVDFDIWDPKLGFGDESHKVIYRPLVWDAFCSIAKNFDDKRIILLGGNKEPKPNSTDTQRETIFFNTDENEFNKTQKLNYPRWYGSVITLGNQEVLIVGGHDKTTNISSITPEILKKDSNGSLFWKPLNNAKSKEVFGKNDADEWSYPKAFLASDGSVVGISYNKLWKLNYENDGEIIITGRIPLEKNGVKKISTSINPNNNSEQKIILGTIGAGVGSTSTTVMIDKDKVLQFGGWQWDDKDEAADEAATEEFVYLANEDFYELPREAEWKGYLPSNHVNLIDFQNTNNPKVQRMKNMNYSRAGGHSTILPTGDVFIHGGVSFKGSTNNFDDKHFSVFKPEIYRTKKNSWDIMSKTDFRRNYHASILLLQNGSILVGGGDVWNAEIFYPPYLFERKENNKIVLAKRPSIEKIDSKLKRGKNLLTTNNNEDVKGLTILSTGSSTHNQNAELKFQNLSFEKLGNNKISFSIDNNKNAIQRGTYLITLINDKGVPSESKLVFIK